MAINPVCPTCNKEPAVMHAVYGITQGNKCVARDKAARHFTKKGNRRPLTEYEKKKLQWYRSEKAWHEDIQSRKIVTDSYGNKVPVYTNERGEITGRMPGPRDRQ